MRNVLTSSKIHFKGKCKHFTEHRLCFIAVIIKCLLDGMCIVSPIRGETLIVSHYSFLLIVSHYKKESIPVFQQSFIMK